MLNLIGSNVFHNSLIHMTLTDIPSAESRSAKAKRFAKEGAKVFGVAAFKIVTRTIAWGAFGLVLGITVWNLLYWTGLLEIDWPPWTYVVFLVLVLYALLGAGGLGYVGGWRGIGRTILYVGVERGLVAYLVDTLLNKMVDLLNAARQTSKHLDSAVEISQNVVENIPLQQWEERLKVAVQTTLNEDDEVAPKGGGITRSVARRVRAFLIERIETYLLTIVRQEINADDGGGGGVSIDKVRTLALEQVDLFFEDFIEGLMQKKLLIGLALLAVLYAIAPSVAYFV